MKRLLARMVIILVAGVLCMAEMPLARADTPEKRRAAAEILLAACMEKNSGFRPLREPEGAYALAGVQNIRMVATLTGEYSINQTKTNYGVGGTDLGVMITRGDTTFIAFGDTFYQENQTEDWRNNVLAYTTDGDYADGILFDGMIMGNAKSRRLAKELFAGAKASGSEIAKIPTGGLCIGDRLYLSYMSVREWGPGDGVWRCNHGGVVKSDNDGKTWQYLRNLTWGEDSGFCQMYPVLHGDTVYVVGIGGGRYGPARLMRVAAERYEDKSAYEYLTALKDDGTPVFQAGEEGLANAMPILRPSVGEMSLLYSEYLQAWLITYLSGSDIILRTAAEPWGPWSKAVTIASRADYPICYGAFMNERYVSDDGKKVMFLMSLWAPVYNTVIMEMELVASE